MHWKANEQYLTVELFVNPLNPRVKLWMIQSFLSFESMDRTLKCDHLLTRAELLEAWLALTSVKYHDNLLILMLLNQWLALTMLPTTGPST